MMTMTSPGRADVDQIVADRLDAVERPARRTAIRHRRGDGVGIEPVFGRNGIALLHEHARQHDSSASASASK